MNQQFLQFICYLTIFVSTFVACNAAAGKTKSSSVDQVIRLLAFIGVKQKTKIYVIKF